MDNAAFAQAMALRYLEGKATDSLADRVAALKVIELKAARNRLRPPVNASDPQQ